MKRLEIIANRSVEDDVSDALRAHGAGRHYTKIPIAHGVGGSGPRQGDSVWPEENFMLIIYCEEGEAAAVREAVAEVKRIFPDEGIKLFETG